MTTTTNVLPDGRTKISVKQPTELIASIPQLLGFRPADSVVVLGLGGHDGKQVGPVVRLDLPPRIHEWDVVGLLANAFAQNPGRAVNFVLVGRHPDHPPHPKSLPHVRLVKRLTGAFTELGRKVEHAVWTPEIRGGAHWSCYEKRSCGGVLPDLESTVTAATYAAEGYVTFDSREEMAAQLEPDDPAAIDRRARLLHATEPGPARTVTELTSEVRAAIGQVREGNLAFTDEQVVRLVQAVSDTQVRDVCLAIALQPLAEHSKNAELLWLELVRGTPAPERAEPASLLGYAAYMRGEGALARIALTNALEADPAHLLSSLLLRCLDNGISPKTLRHLGHPGDTGHSVIPPALKPPPHRGDTQ
jgi:hypothetical protein